MDDPDSVSDRKEIDEKNTGYNIFGYLIELKVDSLAVGFDWDDEDDEEGNDEVVADRKKIE